MTETKSTFGLDRNIACALTYVGAWVTGLIFLLSEKSDKTVRFHAMQSIIFFGGINIIQIVLGRIPLIGWSIMPLLGLLAFVVWIICIIKAYQGDKFMLPVIGEIAEKQANK